jgi:KaiC/GvpD/RAD55 family RecA-like ATPase
VEERRVSLSEIQEMPRGRLVLLAGPPGAGKSDFCNQVILNGLAMDRPVVLVTTDQDPAEVVNLLEQKGMGQPPPGMLWFVDAFSETVGTAAAGRPDTVVANCEDLNSITMAIAKLELRMGRKNILLAFDSLTSPYLFNQVEMFRFVRLCLAKLASEGNSVLALVDEGCGKEQDLVAMMSVADGILRMEVKDGSRTLNVVKHPRVEPARIEVPIEPKQPHFRPPMDGDPDVVARLVRSSMTGKAVVRPEVGDFVNLFWPNLAHWSCMLWDPKGFPTVLYDMNKYECTAETSGFPSSMRLGFKVLDTLQSLGLYMPKSPSKVEGMKKM